MIRILWKEGHYDYVKPEILNGLIEREEIISFRRRSGVVILGLHPVRRRQPQAFQGEERRHAA